MRAIVQDTYGTADALELQDIDRPVAGRGEVLVAVRAAGVDAGVVHLMEGTPLLVRLGYGLRRPRHRVPGLDMAGLVAAVGPDVTECSPGDEVMGIGKGAFAEYAIAPAAKLVPRPASLSFVAAAALPISGLTGLQAVRDTGGVSAGQRVLVVGAAGGVGTYAVQVAVALGAEVTGVCSTTKLELVRSLGAIDAIDYTVQDFTDGSRTWDVIIDTAGNRRLAVLRRALAPDGTLVLVGADGEGRWLSGLDRHLRAAILSPFTRQRLRPMLSVERKEDLVVLADMVATGDVAPVIDQTFPLAEAPAAIRHVQQGRARGKVVVTT